MDYTERRNELKDHFLYKRFQRVKDKEDPYTKTDYLQEKARLLARFFNKAEQASPPQPLSPREEFELALKTQTAAFQDRDGTDKNTRHHNHYMRVTIAADLADRTSRKPGFNSEPGLRHCV